MSGDITLRRPDAVRLLETVSELARGLSIEMRERDLASHFIESLERVFPERGFAVRVFDPRSADEARVYSNWEVRSSLGSERIHLKRSALEKTQLKSAVAASARLSFEPRWDSPFVGVAAGFAIPMVAAGELYGVLDVGYALGRDQAEDDEPLIVPMVNQVSMALRNKRLHRVTTVLRDYQAKLIEHANALILGVDRHWRITVCNRALCRLTGQDRNDVVGRDLRDWLPDEERPQVQKVFLKALSGAASDAVDITLLTGEGTRVRTVWSIAAISGLDREVEAIVAIGQDQTKLQELQRQVIQAEKLATLGQLAAGVVHELNNPLTSITVYADFLLRKAERQCEERLAAVPEASDVEKLSRIAGGAQRILEFARDLVQYASPAGSELDMVSIDQVIRQSMSFCEHLFEKHQIALVEDLQGDLPRLYAVPGQLEQVVINLVTNAVHAVEPGGTVSVRSFLAEDGKVGFEIIDDGPGIAATDLERIFEPFFTTKTNGEGTGLGLSIVRNIIEQHNGTISVDSPAEGGAHVRVVLPTANA